MGITEAFHIVRDTRVRDVVADDDDEDGDDDNAGLSTLILHSCIERFERREQQKNMVKKGAEDKDEDEETDEEATEDANPVRLAIPLKRTRNS